jgi:trans-aconitate 2-methyltransferase
MDSNIENNNWDAETYHKVSNIQESWAIEILEKRKFKVNEVVLDAGCGTGRVTKIIANNVKRGKVYAVDVDDNMITNAKKNLKDFSNIVFIKSDLSVVKLPEKMDLIFSNAVIHWVLNHKKLFTNFSALLKPGGELLIQCGGQGNLGTIPIVLEKVRKSNSFKNYFENWNTPWNFASSTDTKKILEDIGFKNIQVNLTKKIANFQNYQEYILFMKTVVIKPYLSYLPTDNNNKIKNLFIDEFFRELDKENNRNTIERTIDTNFEIDYARLNITGTK